jgi:hypothetical protein
MFRNPWTDEDNAKLKSLAGKVPASTIAGELGRTKAALVVQASKLKSHCELSSILRDLRDKSM